MWKFLNNCDTVCSLGNENMTNCDIWTSALWQNASPTDFAKTFEDFLMTKCDSSTCVHRLCVRACVSVLTAPSQNYEKAVCLSICPPEYNITASTGRIFIKLYIYVYIYIRIFFKTRQEKQISLKSDTISCNFTRTAVSNCDSSLSSSYNWKRFVQKL